MALTYHYVLPPTGQAENAPVREMFDDIKAFCDSLPSSGGGAPLNASFVTIAANATLTNERVLTGTANQVVITDHGANSTVVLSLPQDIATASRPSFAGFTQDFLLGNIPPATFTATPTTGGSLAGGTYYYMVWPVFGGLIGAPSRVRSSLISGGNNATALVWAAVTGTTTYRVSRGASASAPDGYWTVSGTSYTDTGASFTAAGNPFTQATAQWGQIAGNIIMPGSTGGIYFRSWADGSIVANISLTSADEMQYITGTSGVHAFIDVNNAGMFQINRVSTRTEISAFNTSAILGDLDITYGNNLNIRPGNSTAFTFTVHGLSTPAGAAATPALDLAGEHTGLYLPSTGVASLALAGVQAYTWSASAATPAGDNTQNLGSGSAHWQTLFLGTQLINAATTNQILLGTTHTITITAPAPAASRVYTVPDAGGAANFLLSGWAQIVNADISASAAITYSKLFLTGGIVNADVNASAAIAYSKLALSGSIVNADINASAAIAYSKLNLTGSVVNADIGSSAAIAYSKLASLTSAHILVGSAGNVATDTAVTGEVTITNAGVTALATTIANAHTFSGQLTLSNAGGQKIHGTNTNDTATAGDIGELATASRARTSATSLSTNTAKDVTSITLAAGQWTIIGAIGYAFSAAGTYVDCALSLTTATLPATTTLGIPTVAGEYWEEQSLAITATADHIIHTIAYPIQLSGSTTLYLVARCGFGSGTATAYGSITATRGPR